MLFYQNRTAVHDFCGTVFFPSKLWIELLVLLLFGIISCCALEGQSQTSDDVCLSQNCEGNKEFEEHPSYSYEEVRSKHSSQDGKGEHISNFVDSVGLKDAQTVESSTEYSKTEIQYRYAPTDKTEQNNEDKDLKETDSSGSRKETSENENQFEDEGREEFLPSLGVIGPVRVTVPPDENDQIQTEGPDTESAAQQVEQNAPRRRFFPLLYTLRTLFGSFISEFGDEGGNQENAFNSTETTHGNYTTSEELINEMNATVNGTEAGRKTRFQCAVKNITFGVKGQVKIANSTELLEILNSSKNQKMSSCVLVMFYAPWCHFCAKTAPHYNALARAFPQLDVLAVDTSHFSYLNARFGTVAVPNVMLFHARSAVRFNHTSRILHNLIQFVTNNTGLEPDKSVLLEPTDFVGPLPSIVVRGRDWLLWLAWTFVILCSTYGFVRSRYGQHFFTRLRVLWQEHQHIE